MGEKASYVVITPARDEGEYIEKTILSMVGQTIRPKEWVIVDDGSKDHTGKIIDDYGKRYDWIKVVHRKNRGFRQAGTGVVEAFYAGYNALQTKDWDFIVKLDGDLMFDKDYFERSLLYFEKDDRLGIGGGGIYHILDGKEVLEEDHAFHVRGATKIYRRACWDDIGGLHMVPGWDTLDEVKANMLGWKTRGFPELKVIHLRFTGKAEGSWRNAVKNGRASYISGYHPLFMIFKAIKRLSEKPYLIVSVGLLYGYFGGYLKKVPMVNDRELIKYIRKEQLKRIFFQKSIYSKDTGFLENT
ncbi:MAG: glycosyltransferase family 2 protein [Syntrophorhabdaceae bacterium]|nr:glycosyltransferase family 2 protein [Syntrophorhabdaceae bacterium]